ncbi:MAG: hypothetical protein ACI9J3_002645 [Parvicellaceae bacterium]|jgi:hypothetical protein
MFMDINVALILSENLRGIYINYYYDEIIVPKIRA